ncbi:Calx-beta domain-containing protein [Allomuricauda sp. SCSIO 65647]|uniref:Calx-beta domain-containing protein n=1 Tax=Allomuricauda sp. SCSIO 65647 TaxID=2908843 RepID=UPI001F40ED67|nr:Calx-beta domain-containing protein [Muricauda sp. SCSIO 65647]UJH68129.1 hypothetical protein L0P89_02700 [Muricauda sp. SCSIO 65647]
MKSKTTPRFKTPVFLLLLLISMASFGQVQTPFTPRYSETINGDVTIIANNVLSRHATNAYNGSDGNHDFSNNVFVDIDSDASTFNSSSANFSNPAPAVSCLNFKKVFLYWAAADKEYDNYDPDDDDGTGTGSSSDEPSWNYNQVKLMLPGQTTYTTITADEVLYRGRDDHFVNDPYVCVKDITTEIQGLTNPYGKFQVANVKATEGDLYSHGGGHTGTSGGWQIVFVYESTELLGKNVTLFDGYVHITQSQGEVEFDFNGFQTVPNGNVNADIVLGSLEGDRDIPGDQLQIFDTNGVWSNLSTTLRDENNFFNSRITIDNQNYTDRNPASTNTLGFDAAVFDLKNGGNKFIDNNQTSARLRITSDQETYGVYLIGLSVEVYEPSLGALNFTSSSSGGGFNPGDQVQMTLSIENSGNDDIQDLEIFTTLPPEVDFVDTETLPPGVTHNFNSTTRELRFFVPNGNTDVGNPLYTLDFNVLIKDQCYFLESACSATFAMQATATFRGVTNTNPVTTDSSGTTDSCGIGNHDPTIVDINQPDQVNWITAADALNRTVSCDDTAALNAAQALEPQTEFCNFTLNKVAGSFAPNPGCDSEGTYTNTFTFTDACGRVSDTFTQVITIEDIEDPSFVEALPSDTVAPYDNIPSPATLTATDNCDTNASVNFNETYIGDNSSTTYTIVRTWTASDCAGNSIQHIQNIFVTEDGDPLGLSINDITVNENVGTATLQVTHVGFIASGFTVNYDTADGDAVEPGDYVQASNALSFVGSHGEVMNIDITINDDSVIEFTEAFNVNLSSGTNTPPINDNSGEITILDNDGGGSNGIAFDATSVTVNEGDGTATFTVRLTGNVQGGFTVDYATNDGSAGEPGDYTDVSGTLNFTGNDGESYDITVPIIDDSLIEPTEDFTVLLDNLSTTLIGINGDTATGNILDNDGGGSNGIAFDATSVTVNEGDGTATFTVRLTGNVQGGFTVDYATNDGSAGEPGDYTDVSGTLNFTGNDGESYDITVPIIDDSLIEPTEDFTVLLDNLSTTLIGINGDTATGNILDNDGGGSNGIAFDATSVTVNEGDGTATFTVRLTGNVQGGFTVDYATNDGSAGEPGDYTDVSGTLNFTGNDGESYDITVPIIDDSLIEPTEDFTVLLDNLSTTLIGINGDTATGNILDNDGGGSNGIAFDATSVTVNEGDGTATFTVRLTGNVGGVHRGLRHQRR